MKDFNIFIIIYLFLLLKDQPLLAATETNLAQEIGSLKEKLSAIYEKYDKDFTPNIQSILENECQNFFNSLDNLTNEQFHLMEILERKWTKLNKIFLINSPKRISEFVDKMDKGKREELGKFGQMLENAVKLMQILATANNAKFEQFVLALFNALKGTAEHAEYVKHFENQSKVLHVYSIYLKYAKEKVDNILGKDPTNWKEVEKYDKKLGKYLEFILTKIGNKSNEKLEEFVIDLMRTSKINTSYRQKAGSVLVNYRNHYRNELMESIPSIVAGKMSVENFVKQLTNFVAEYSEEFVKKWLTVEKMGEKHFSRYRSFIWRQISDKSIRAEDKVELAKFIGQLFERGQFFELQKYDANFEKLLAISRRNKAKESKFMQMFMEIPEIIVANFRKFSFKNFLARIEIIEMDLIKKRSKRHS